MDKPTQEQIRKCTRCGATRTDDVDSNICGTCADDLRMEQEATRHDEGNGIQEDNQMPVL